MGTVAHVRTRREVKSQSILVVDGNFRLADILAQLIEDEPGLSCVGVCAAPEQALATAIRQHPDVVLIAETLSGSSGAALCRDLRQLLPHATLLLWTHDPYRRPATDVSADALLARGMTFRELVRTIRYPHQQRVPAPGGPPSNTAPPAVPQASYTASPESGTARPETSLGLACDTCELQVLIPTHDMSLAVIEARAFFDTHSDCTTSVDLTGRRLVPASDPG